MTATQGARDTTRETSVIRGPGDITRLALVSGVTGIRGMISERIIEMGDSRSVPAHGGLRLAAHLTILAGPGQKR